MGLSPAVVAVSNVEAPVIPFEDVDLEVRRTLRIRETDWDAFRQHVLGTSFGLPPQYGRLQVVDFQPAGDEVPGYKSVLLIYQPVGT